MTPILKLVFYALSAVAIFFLARRYVRRRRAERGTSRHEQVSSPSDYAAGLGAGSVDLTPPPLPRPIAPIAVAEAIRADAKTVAEVDPQQYAPSSESRSHRVESWSDRALFYVGDEVDSTNPVPLVEPHQIPVHGVSDRLFGSVNPVFAALLPESGERLHEAKRELRSAGYYQPHALENLSALRYVLMIAGILFFGAMLLIVPARLEGPTLFALVAAAVAGWSMPRLIVRGKATQRLSEIEHAMPDMLDMLNMSVSQGITIQESLGRVGRQLETVSPALSQELKIVSDQAKIGSLDQALLNFSDRIDLPEVHSFASLVNQTDRMGTSVSEALEQYSDNMRENLRQRADEKGNRATFRLLFPTVLFLMPAVFIFLLGPAIVEMSEFYNGQGRDLLGRNRQTVEGLNTPNVPGAQR